MRISLRRVAIASIGVLSAQCAIAQASIPPDLHQLIGKKVIVGRMPLCMPKTYATNLTYAGKPAEFVSISVTMVASVSDQALKNMAPAVRSMVEDQRKGGTVLFRFAEGTELDTCVDQGYTQLAAGIELAPGETLPEVDVPATTVASSNSPTLPPGPLPNPATSAQECPVVIAQLSSDQGGMRDTLGEALTTSEFQRQLDETTHEGVATHYLDSRLRNVSQKPIAAIESVAIYMDRMGDQSATATLVTQNDKPIAPGKEFQSNYMDRAERTANGAGLVTLYVHRIRFQDQSLWQDNGSHSCSLSSKVK
jgi:hypothetical protein